MPYYKFGPNDLLYNQLKAHPQTEFIIYNRASYYNKVPQITGSHVVNVGCIGTGNVSLYELNVDRQQQDTARLYQDGNEILHSIESEL